MGKAKDFVEAIKGNRVKLPDAPKVVKAVSKLFDSEMSALSDEFQKYLSAMANILHDPDKKTDKNLFNLSQTLRENTVDKFQAMLSASVKVHASISRIIKTFGSGKDVSGDINKLIADINKIKK